MIEADFNEQGKAIPVLHNDKKKPVRISDWLQLSLFTKFKFEMKLNIFIIKYIYIFI
jgi:hypothetical protein